MSELLTREAAAEYLQIGINTLGRLIQSGEIKAAKIGRKFLIRKGDLDSYTAEIAEKQTAQRRGCAIPDAPKTIRRERGKHPALPEIPA